MSENQSQAATGGSRGGGGMPGFDGDIAAMNAQIAHLDATVLPHLELLTSQAKRAGNSGRTLGAIAKASEAVTSSRAAAATAVQAVRQANEKVRRAYADSGDEAAKEKPYFNRE